MLPEDRSYIRTKAMAVLLNAARTHHAVIRWTDTSKDPRDFHRLVGGSVELGERSVDAVVREIGEELGTTLLEPRLLGVLENVFDYEGQPGHEIVFLYAGELADPGIVSPMVAGSRTTACRCSWSGARSRTQVTSGRSTRAARGILPGPWSDRAGLWSSTSRAEAAHTGWRALN